MKAQKGKQGPRRQQPQQVRIIGGQWKRTPLPVAAADGLRPTPDRVRETVFNWINHQLGSEWKDLHCLDLFAGTGALGFEAASRGAAQVTMVEASTTVWNHLDAIKTKLKAEQVHIIRGDALRFAQAAANGGQRFNLIFLDPPYQQEWLPKILPLCAQILTEGGLVYAESANALEPNNALESPDFLSGWEIIRSDRAGMVFYSLLRR